MTRTTLILLLAGLTALAAGPGCNETEFNEDRDLADLQEMEAEIDAFIGDAECGDIGDCRVIAFGDKPCGGPWSYKVFNAKATDPDDLEQMIAEYNQFNEVLNERYGWMSDCMLVEPPVIDCLGGRCLPLGLL